eukprot:3933878-Rhodomonas_salina.2
MHDFLNSVEPTEGTVIGDPALYTAAFVYIGLRRFTAGSGDFSWVDGTSYDYDLGFANPNDNDCVHKIGKGAFSTTKCHRENAFMCEFDPPTFDETCIKHVIQRPKYSSPNPNRPCWDVQTWQESDGWFNAKEHCEAKGGYLPVIEDAEENWFFRRLLDWKGHWDAWLGVTKNTTTDEWSYPDGVARPSFYHNPSDIDRTPWRTGGYPTDLPWCVLVAPGGRWYNGDCERRRSVVCEFDRETHPDKTCMSDQLEDLHPNWDLVFPNNAQSFIDVGKFKGMPASPGIGESVPSTLTCPPWPFLSCLFACTGSLRLILTLHSLCSRPRQPGPLLWAVQFRDPAGRGGASLRGWQAARNRGCRAHRGHVLGAREFPPDWPRSPGHFRHPGQHPLGEDELLLRLHPWRQ